MRVVSTSLLRESSTEVCVRLLRDERLFVDMELFVVSPEIVDEVEPVLKSVTIVSRALFSDDSSFDHIVLSVSIMSESCVSDELSRNSERFVLRPFSSSVSV